MFEKNINFNGVLHSTAWRKIAIGTWKNCNDAAVYGTFEVDASALLEFIKTHKRQANIITPTAIVAKAVALAIKEYPRLNSILSFGRIYQRKTIDIFLHVSEEKEDQLSGMLIGSCEKKSLISIAEQIKSQKQVIKRGDDFNYKKIKLLIDKLPWFLVKPMLNLTSFIMYDLNLWFPLLNTPKDSFGSAMVTSVGMLGIDNGFAPLVPYSRCPAIFSVGAIKKKPIVINDSVVIRPMMTISATLDHRLIDGRGSSILVRAIRDYIENYERISLK
jgi:pyruvate/2-oxoglutarate dehydrogenase complex dihydrolipoamide acyltransferase (E2) component